MKKLYKLYIMVFLLSILGAGNAYALTQAEIDAQTGPTFGVSSTMTAGGPEVASVPEIKEEEAALNAAEHGETGNYIGTFKATAYCAGEGGVGNMTASGKAPTPDHTIAADLSVLPMGSRVMIKGSDIVYTVEDTGVSGNTIDLFLSSYDACIQFGVQNVELYWAK